MFLLLHQPKRILSLVALHFLFLTSCNSGDIISNQGENKSSDSQVVAAITFQGQSDPIVLKGGTTYMISWGISSGQSQVISIFGSVDGGTTWSTIEPYASNEGLYSFKSPLVDSDHYLINIVMDGVEIARSSEFRVVATPPKLDPNVFSSSNTVSHLEFQKIANGVIQTPSNPSLNGFVWNFDLKDFVITKAGLVVILPVSHSQYGGIVSCTGTVCNYSAPVTDFQSDSFVVQLADTIQPSSNRSELITINIVPNFSPEEDLYSDASVSGVTIIADSTDYLSKVASLGPGDTLKLSPGSYGPMPLSSLNGTELKPITIESLDSNNPAVLFGNISSNVVEISQSSHIIIKGLHLNGMNNAASDGIKSTYGNSNLTHHITILNCEFKNFSGSQQQVAISTKSPTWGWRIAGNIIHDAGTGLYLGNSAGDMPFFGGTIESNFVQNTVGYNMQIKHQILNRPSLDGMPTSQQLTVIRNNVFMKADIPSPDGVRPNVLLGGFPDIGVGSSDYYEVYGNFFYDNPTSESLLQVTGRVSIHHNIFAKATSAAIRVMDHSNPVKVVHIFQNTIYDSPIGIDILNSGISETRLVGNLIFAAIGIQGNPTHSTQNIIDLTANAGNILNNPSAQLGVLDLYPKSGQAKGIDLDLSPFVSNSFGLQSQATFDFNGNANSMTYRGAYSGDRSNLGWALVRGLKGANGTSGADPSNPSIVGPPALIDPNDILSSSVDSSAQMYCPDMTQSPASGIYRLCNSGDASAGCTGSADRVLKPLSGQTLAQWTTAFQAFLTGIPDGSRLEVVYNNSLTNAENFDFMGKVNQFTSCDLNILQNNLVIAGVCRADPQYQSTFRYNTSCPKNLSNPSQSKGSFVNKGDHNKFINLKFSSNYIFSDFNGAAIRDEGSNMTVAYDYFFDGNNGILSGQHSGAAPNFILIDHCKFEGLGSSGAGLAHGIYLSEGVSHAYIKDSLFLRAKNHGHEAKSRSQQTTVKCSVFSGRARDGGNSESVWEDNALIDLPQGGKVLIQYNTLVKGTNTHNGANIVAFAEESGDATRLNYYQDFTFKNNYLYNRMVGSHFLNYYQHVGSSKSAPTFLDISSNTFVGLGLSYVKGAFFKFAGGGVDLSFDLTQSPHGNTLGDLTSGLYVPYSGSDGQYVIKPGFPDASVACPDFEWLDWK